jgi:hypothetical protein
MPVDDLCVVNPVFAGHSGTGLETGLHGGCGTMQWLLAILEPALQTTITGI